MILYKETAELKPYYPFNKNMELTVLETYLRQAGEQFISRFIGATQYNDLLAKYEADPTPVLTTEYTALLDQVRKPLTAFAAGLAVPFLNVNIGAGGITRRKTETDESAFEWSVTKLERSAINTAFQGLEQLLGFLETNIADYPLYAADPLYTARKELFLKSAGQFNEEYNISNQFRTYQSFLHILKRVEKQAVKPLIGKDLFNELKTQLLADSVTADNEELLDLIRPAVAHLTVATAITQLAIKIDDQGITVHEGTTNKSFKKVPAPPLYLDELKRSATIEGNNCLQILKDYLNDNASTYPLYESSELYNEDGFCPRFDNDTDNNFFVA